MDLDTYIGSLHGFDEAYEEPILINEEPEPEDCLPELGF